jgi:hypothetical protein
MYRATQLVLGGLVLALVGGTASASTLNGTCTMVGPQSPDITASITCTQFNLTGLQSISLTINGLMVGTITITNNDPTPENVNASVNSDWSLSPPLSGFSFPSPLFVLSFGTGSVSIPAMTTRTFPSTGQFTNSNSDNATDGNAATFAPYEGAGSFSIPVTSATSLSLTEGVGCNPCSVTSSTMAQLTETASVVYTYSAITTGAPEPGTLTFLGSGLLLLLIGARRRRRI